MHVRFNLLLLLNAIFDKVTNYHTNMKLWLLRDCDGEHYELNLLTLKERDKARWDIRGFACIIIWVNDITHVHGY